MTTANDSRRARSGFALSLLCAVFLIVGAHAAHAGVKVWTTHGPHGGVRPVAALAIDPVTPSTLYAGTDGGVYRSTNGGGSWTTVNTGLDEDTSVTAFTIDPTISSTVYAVGRTPYVQHGVYRSTDSGGSWSAVNTGLDHTASGVQGLVIDPVTPSTLYVYGQTSDAFKSTDSGGSWTAMAITDGLFYVAVLVIDPHTPSTLYAAGTSGGGVYKSTDSGASWSPANIGLPNYQEPGSMTNVYALVIDPLTPRTLYAGTDLGVFQSTNSGVTWTAINSGLTVDPYFGLKVFELAIDPKTPSTLYAGTRICYGECGSLSVYQSTNGGSTWNQTNSPSVPIFDPLTPSTLYAGTGSGVFQSTDSGVTWTAVNSGLTEDLDVGTLAIDPLRPSTLYAGTYGSGVFQSTDSGGSWSAVNTGLGDLDVRALAIDPITPSTLYAASWGSGVFKSTDSGTSWSAVSTGLPADVYADVYVTALAIDPKTPSTLYAASWGVFKSTDSGANWSAVNTGLTNTNAQALAIDPTTPSTVYVGIGGVCDHGDAGTGLGPCLAGGVFESTDSGANWTAINNGLSSDLFDILILALLIDPATPSTLYAVTEICGPECGPAQVYRSTDSGGSWSAVNTRLGDLNVQVLAIDPISPSTLYAGAAWGGVFQSTDSGASWIAINNGLTDSYGYVKQVIALAIDPKTPRKLYAGTWGGGVFDIELTCLVGTGTSASCTEAALDACFPGGAGFAGAVAFNCGPDPVTITVTSTKTVSSNTTIDGGGLITINGGNRVGVFSVYTGVNFTVQNLTIANGRAFRGGGTFNSGGTVTVTNSTFVDNSADYGGAIDNVTGGTLTVTNSTFSGNSTVYVTNPDCSTFCPPFPGFAINNSGTVTVTNSTFSDNWGGNASNSGGTLTVTNTIIADSTAFPGAFPSCQGTITDGGHNLDDGTSCGFSTANGSLSNTDPKLAAGLANNGGPTETIALLSHSPAIDAGDPEVCASPPVNGVDQRGYRRPGGGSNNCSIGAYEYGAWELPLCDGDCNGDGVITVDEVMTGVNIALGNISVCSCMPCDMDNNGLVSIAELIRAVNYALTGCPFWNANGLGQGGELQASAQARLREMQARCVE